MELCGSYPLQASSRAVTAFFKSMVLIGITVIIDAGTHDDYWNRDWQLLK
jgi:hypothetical protein